MTSMDQVALERPRPGATRSVERSSVRGVAVGALLALLPAAASAQQALSAVSLDSLLEVTISTAARTEQTMLDAPASVTIITAEDIAAFGYRTLADVLGRVRGIHLTSDRNYTYAGVRGFGRSSDYNDRILLLLNGHTINESVYGSGPLDHELGLNIDAVERIVVVRGPVSALYGTGAMFAVVDIITKTAVAADRRIAAATVGMNGERVADALYGMRAGRVDLLLAARIGESNGEDLHFPDLDAPETNHGVAADLDWERHASVMGSVRAGGFALDARYTSRKKGIPTGAFGTVFNEPGTFTRDEWASAEARYGHTLSPALRLDVRAWFDAYFYSGAYVTDVVETDSTTGTRAGAEAMVMWDPRANNRITAGIAFERNLRADYRAWYADEPVFAGDYPFGVQSIFVQDELHITSRLSVSAGLRWDHREGAKSSATPRGAIVLRPGTGTSIKALYAESFREPNVYERWYEDPGDFKSNPSLERERIRALELVWEQQLAAWARAGVSVFRYRVDDLVDVTQDPADELYHFANVEMASSAGVELEVEARTDDGTAAYANWSIQRTEDADGERLTNAPVHLVKAGIVRRVAGPLRAAPELRYESSRLTLDGTETAGGIVARLHLSGDLTRHLRVSALFDNLFDRTYSTPAGYEHPVTAIPQPGRSVRLRAELRF